MTASCCGCPLDPPADAPAVEIYAGYAPAPEIRLAVHGIGECSCRCHEAPRLWLRGVVAS